jgi:hypothetical protein
MAKKTKKKTSKPQAKLGRPEKEFSDDEVRRIEQMAFDQCQNRTIAKVIECAVETLEKHFSTVLVQKRAEGKGALRRAQMKQAQTIPTMAIFLGKNYLEQTDKRETDLDVKVKDIPVFRDVDEELSFLEERKKFLLQQKDIEPAIAE